MCALRSVQRRPLAPCRDLDDSCAAVKKRYQSRSLGRSRRAERQMTEPASLADIPLPSGIRSRFVEDINGLRVHVLESGYETRGRPCVLLLHGFPELAYSCRKVMPVLEQ